MCLRDDLLVESDESVNGSFSDLQRRKVREKVITNKETHEHPVINGSLWEGRREEGEEGEEGGEGRGGRGEKGGKDKIRSVEVKEVHVHVHGVDAWRQEEVERRNRR